MMGLTFNEKALDRLTKSLHISIIMKKNPACSKEVSTSRDVSHQKEEGRSRIIEEKKNREKIRHFLSILIHPFDIENHPVEDLNMHTP